jgi:rubrerythrin
MPRGIPKTPRKPPTSARSETLTLVPSIDSPPQLKPVLACQNCGHTWRSRNPSAKRCPNCGGRQVAVARTAQKAA